MSKIIAIDGPAGSGKGTITKLVAEKLHLVYIDSGATYRCVALACLRNNIKLEEKKKIIALTKSLDIDFTLDGRKQTLPLEGYIIRAIILGQIAKLG